MSRNLPLTFVSTPCSLRSSFVDTEVLVYIRRANELEVNRMKKSCTQGCIDSVTLKEKVSVLFLLC